MPIRAQPPVITKTTCFKVSWCFLNAVHTRRTQQEPVTRAEPGETECTAATHERAWLDFRLPRRRTWFDFRLSRSRIFACGNRAERCHWSAGFLGDIPLPLSFHSGATPYSTTFTPIGSQALDVNSCRNIFTHSPYRFPNYVSKTWRSSPINCVATSMPNVTSQAYPLEAKRDPRSWTVLTHAHFRPSTSKLWRTSLKLKQIFVQFNSKAVLTSQGDPPLSVASATARALGSAQFTATSLSDLEKLLHLSFIYGIDDNVFEQAAPCSLVAKSTLDTSTVPSKTSHDCNTSAHKLCVADIVKFFLIRALNGAFDVHNSQKKLFRYTKEVRSYRRFSRASIRRGAARLRMHEEPSRRRRKYAAMQFAARVLYVQGTFAICKANTHLPEIICKALAHTLTPRGSCSCVADEFCEEFPHNLIPTPGYWIECSRQKITSDTIWDESESEHELNEEEEEEERGGGAAAADDEGGGGGAAETPPPGGRCVRLDDDLCLLEDEEEDDDLPRKKTAIEEQWEKQQGFELTSVEQETYEKYFYGTEHWNYFTNDEDLGPVILSIKQETINGRDQFRCRWLAGFIMDLLFPGALSFRHRFIPTSLHPHRLSNLDVKSRSDIFTLTHSLIILPLLLPHQTSAILLTASAALCGFQLHRCPEGGLWFNLYVFAAPPRMQDEYSRLPTA
ncbi:hypothetical protein PR048_001259 [Dryococelus australis]|uniref:Uncharacterized protein n=1 Tax=Dryococelus australis TaxID=614101 RepID=A0ABQ9IGZ9_9NEOP|nr:hypothetical protein PR048_001259 [Dryococelus australis]